MLKATSDSGELNSIDWRNFIINVVMFDLPAYLLTAVNIRLGGGTWESALLEPLPVFLIAFIDLTKKYVKQN